MTKKNKSHTAGSDAAVMYLSVLAGVLAMATVVAPWYYKPLDPSMGLGWTVTRSYSPLGATDMTEGSVSWGTLSETICKKSNQYTSQASGIAGLGTQLVTGLVGKAAEAKTGVNLGVDGARMLGCGHWPSCREHVATRCALYRTMKVSSMAAAGLIGIGALCGFLTVGMLKMEEGVKKKNAVLEARMKTMIAACAGAACIAIGCLIFKTQMDTMLKTLNDSAYYPMPDMYVGFGMAGLAIAQSCCACCCAIYRKSNAFPAKEADEAPMMADGAAGGYGGYPPAGQYGGYQQY
jgi:hypothetical protein